MNMTFQLLQLFLPSREGVADTYSSNPLERANPSHWTMDDERKKNPIVINHRQNLLESIQLVLISLLSYVRQ
jgi:hypothetical protein